MEAQINQAFHLVSQPSNDIIRQGEHLLHQLKRNSDYPLALLNYINNNSVNEVGKLRAAIQLKLWCQHYKDIQHFERQQYSHLIEDIKKGVLSAYLTFPLKISKTLRPGIISLADVLFPNNWRDLLGDLLAYGRQVPTSTTAILKIIQNISQKYSYESRSDPLYEQIILMCNQVHDYLLDLTVTILMRVQQDPNNIDQVTILQILMKIFYNLNYQDLHPKYEDNLQNWMNILKQIMNIHNTNQSIFKCKGAALEAILLYASKYKEDVQQPIKGFCQQIWQLCSGASEDPQYDQVVFNCLKFFKSLIVWPEMKPFFIQNMENLFQNLILPNIGITKTLIGLFQDEIDLYIDYYFRNTQMQTRRAAALQLLRVVCRHYNNFEPFLQQQLHNFQNQVGNVQAQCTILSLTIDGSSKGFRDVDGCTQLFVQERIIQYTYHNIAKQSLFGIYDWMKKNQNKLIQNNFNVIHIATVIRFLFYFRIYFPKQELSPILQFLTSIKTENKSLLKVIYLSINGFLIMKHGDFTYFKNLVPYFNGENLKPIAVEILKVIYEGTTKEQALQESLTKMISNLTRALGSQNKDFFNHHINIIKEMLQRTVVYDFTSVQYLFQTIGYLSYWLIRTTSPDKSILQKEVMSYFYISLKNKSDLVNFCLQIMAIFLQLEPNTNPQYKNIYDSLLMPQNWKQQNQSLMSSFIQFIISFISKFKVRLIQDKSSIQLILSKIIEIDHVQLFYRFIQAIMMHTTLDQFYNSGYLMLVVQGGPIISKSIQGRKATLLFICKLTIHYDIIPALRYINDCCPFYYDQILQASLDIVKSLSQRVERKCLFISICRAIKSNYFQNIDFLAQMINSMVLNTVQKFHFKNITNHVSENEAREKKQSTYKKLLVFKEFQTQQPQISLDQEQELINTFKYVNELIPDLINLIDQKNRDRLMKMHQRYCK